MFTLIDTLGFGQDWRLCPLLASSRPHRGKPETLNPRIPGVGASIMRIGFEGLLNIIMVEYPPKPYANY